MHGIHHPQLAFCLVIFWDCHILCLQLALVCFQTLHCIICGIWLHFVAQSKNTRKVPFSISALPKPSVNSTSNGKPMLEGCQCSQEGPASRSQRARTNGHGIHGRPNHHVWPNSNGRTRTRFMPLCTRASMALCHSVPNPGLPKLDLPQAIQASEKMPSMWWGVGQLHPGARPLVPQRGPTVRPSSMEN